MTVELFERFLFESESDSIDFKRDQYQFSKATDEQKSELLKDILAMVNSWRRVDGYIIIGIKDCPEKPNEKIGIIDHIDDAQLQQFVNSKTNQVCKFEYSTYTIDSLTYGILYFPVQNRPIYLKKDYGKLKADTVYVRRGSSTVEAKIEEISQMGKALLEETKSPVLDLNFHDSNNGESLGKKQVISCTRFSIIDDIPEYRVARNYMNLGLGMENSDYYKEYLDYVNFHTAFKALRFQIDNKGNIEAKNIKLEIIINHVDLECLQDGDEKSAPVKDKLFQMAYIKKVPHQSEYYIEQKSNKIKLYASLQNLHAKRCLDIDGVIYIDPKKTRNLNLTTKIYCDGIDMPVINDLEIECKYIDKSMYWNDFTEYLKEKKVEI